MTVTADTLRLIGSPSQLAHVSLTRVEDGAEYGSRCLEVRPAGGIHCRILIDRGLDVGPAWVGGHPLDWRSPVGFPNAETAASRPWLDTFGGGLFVTCGPDNVGPDCRDAGRDHGLHGRHSATRAHNVRVQVDPLASLVIVTGDLSYHTVFGSSLTMKRTITLGIGSPTLEIRDTVANPSEREEILMLLYHFNFGFPVVSPGSVLQVASEQTRLREGDADFGTDWRHFVEPRPDNPTVVLEHLFADGVDQATVTITNRDYTPADGIAVKLTFDRTELSRLWQWWNQTPDIYLAGIEPANCGVLGRAEERRRHRAPSLSAGESKHFWLRLDAAVGATAIDNLLLSGQDQT